MATQSKSHTTPCIRRALVLRGSDMTYDEIAYSLDITRTTARNYIKIAHARYGWNILPHKLAEAIAEGTLTWPTK